MMGKRPDKRGQGRGQGPAKGPGNGSPRAEPFTSATGREAALRRHARWENVRDARGRWTGDLKLRGAPR